MTRPASLSLLSASRSIHLLLLLWLSLSLPLVIAFKEEEESGSESVSPPKDTVQDDHVQEEVVPDDTIQYPVMYDNHWGRPQLVQGPNRTEIYRILQQNDEYMTNIVYVQPEYATIRQECTNQHVLCTYWAAYGFCEGSESMMDCAPACQICDQLPAFWDAFEEEHEEDETELITYGQFVRTDFGMAQHLGLEDPEEVALIVENSQRYLEELKLDPEFQDKVDGCRNHLRDCSYWAFQGECFNNPHYLDQHCAAACQTCDEIEIQPACLRDNYQPVMWEQPGELNQMFQRVATDPEFQKYSPNVLSGPQDENQGPWIVTLDDFLTQEECDALIQHGADQGYSKSMGIGEMNEDGTYSDAELTGRTSTNTWCDENSTDNPLIKGVIDRIEHLVQVPYSHAEFLQLLKYEPGQFYESHHDWSVNHLEEPMGARILTVFLYLNDVEGGGGTHFTEMNMTVMPKKGRAVLWPSVLDEAPMAIDARTWHEALEVTAGNKYGANAWYHSRDFKGYWKGCRFEEEDDDEEEEEFDNDEELDAGDTEEYDEEEEFDDDEEKEEEDDDHEEDASETEEHDEEEEVDDDEEEEEFDEL